jgi:hypothetical protein
VIGRIIDGIEMPLLALAVKHALKVNLINPIALLIRNSIAILIRLISKLNGRQMSIGSFHLYLVVVFAGLGWGETYLDRLL